MNEKGYKKNGETYIRKCTTGSQLLFKRNASLSNLKYR